MWRQKNAEENPSDSRKVWRIKQHLILNKLEWNVSAAIDSADTKIFWPLQGCFVRLSTLGSSNGPAEALMLDRYFTICTEQECNKVCGPPGRRGRDTSETSLGRDVQKPVQPRPVSGLFSAAGPVRAAGPPLAVKPPPPPESSAGSLRGRRESNVQRWRKTPSGCDLSWGLLVSCRAEQEGGRSVCRDQTRPDRTGPGHQVTRPPLKLGVNYKISFI